MCGSRGLAGGNGCTRLPTGVTKRIDDSHVLPRIQQEQNENRTFVRGEQLFEDGNVEGGFNRKSEATKSDYLR